MLPGEDRARALDAADPLSRFRDQFHIPKRPDGRDAVYLCGHSLGLQPRAARSLVEQELDSWASHGVEGHFQGATGWYNYHELLRDPGARLVGALPEEVVFMNGLTVNLHLLLATFFQPQAGRVGILIDEPTFPSDRYAVTTHLQQRGLDPRDTLYLARPDASGFLDEGQIAEQIRANRDRISVVLLSGVNFLTGQWLDIPSLCAAAHASGCILGLDLAHAVGNVPLRLHDWDVDFAVWCSYKYLNGGPGAVAGCFVHARHGRNLGLPRLGGWWGNDPATRFRMQLEPDFVPRAGADGWQLSNPPILSMAPLRASLGLFDQITMPALRARSLALGAYMLDLLDQLPPGRVERITPREPERRGCQVSLRILDRPRETQAALQAAGVVCDFREPDILRAAPVGLYNTYHDVLSFVRALACTSAQSV